MTLNQLKLRALIESVLLEGAEDDLRRGLLALHPDLERSDDFKKIPMRGLEWLVTRFGKKASRQEAHPIGDTLDTVRAYFEKEKDKALEAKYVASAPAGQYNVFQDAVDRRFPPETRAWNSPADSLNMTADEMETVLTLATDKKAKLVVNVSEEEMESDRVGKVGPWNLWMPSTRERSCAIAQFDPATKAPKTTWCTARMAGSNLFYNYIGRPGAEMTLFYIIRDNPSEVIDWLSLGFINGKAQLDGKDGMMSVDRDNKGLTTARYREILGPDHDQIMQILQAKNDSLGGVHPAREKINAGARSLKGLRYLLQGLNDEEALDMKRMVSHSEKAADEVLAFLSEDADNLIRAAVASNGNTSEKTLRKMSDDVLSVKEAVAANKNTPGDVLDSFITSEYLRHIIAFNPSTPERTLVELYHDYWGYSDIKIALAKNVSTPKSILRSISESSNDGYTQIAAALNPNADPELKFNIAKKGNYEARHTLSYSDTPPDILEILSTDRDERIRKNVAENHNTSSDVLRTMSQNDSSKYVKFYANQNLKQRNEAVTEGVIRLMIRSFLFPRDSKKF
jgi:hypothetical protein